MTKFDHARTMRAASPVARWASTVSVLAVAILSSQAAVAQEASHGVSDIIVTAQKREQRLQDVPVAVSALDADMMIANRITNIRDLDAMVPNFTVRTVSAGSALANYTLRGLNTVGSTLGADKGIAVYIDGVFLGTSSGSVFDVADISRIEVLRGPQGTLFGRNATGGAISIVTREPDGVFSVKQDVTVGNYNQFKSRTRISTPQWGPLSASFSYTHSERRGDIRNLGAGTVWDFTQAQGGVPTLLKSPEYLGDNNSEAISAAVKLDLSDDLKVVYKFDQTQTDYTTAGQGIIYAQPSIRAIMAAQPNQALLTPITVTRPDAVNNAGDTTNYQRSTGHSLTITYEASESLSIKNILARRTSKVLAPFQQLDGNGGLINVYGQPACTAVSSPLCFNTLGAATLMGPVVAAATVGAPFFINNSSTQGFDQQWSDELQFNYRSDIATITAGFLWFENKQTKGAFGIRSGLGTARSGSYAVYPNFQVPYSGQLKYAQGDLSTVTIKSQAVYAQAEVHATPQLDLVAGIRHTKDRKTGIDNTLLSGTNQTSYVIDYRNSRVTYSLGVNYKPTNDILLYAKYSTGFISGTTLSLIDVEPETARSAEAGIKADWFDHKLRTNLAAFYVKYGNLQLTTAGRNLAIPRPEISSALANVGDGRAYGFELETTLVPVSALTLTGNVGYTNFKYTRLLPAVAGGAAEFLPTFRPDWTATVSAQYESPPIFGDMHLLARLDGNWKSKFYTTAAIPLLSGTNPSFTAAEQAIFKDASTVQPYWIVNGRIALTDIQLGSGGKAELALWGRNLFDNKSLSFAASLTTSIAADYERARTFGVDLSVQF